VHFVYCLHELNAPSHWPFAGTHNQVSRECGALIAHNRCYQCGHTWNDRPYGYARQSSCPRCGSKYWVWVNYEARESAESERTTDSK